MGTVAARRRHDIAPDRSAIAAPPPVTPMPQIKLPIETRRALPNSMDMTVAVREVRITGSTAFSENQLMPLVADAMGNALNIQEWDAIADRITRFYRDRR